MVANNDYLAKAKAITLCITNPEYADFIERSHVINSYVIQTLKNMPHKDEYVDVFNTENIDTVFNTIALAMELDELMCDDTAHISGERFIDLLIWRKTCHNSVLYGAVEHLIDFIYS